MTVAWMATTAASTVLAAPLTINVGNRYLIPNTAGQSLSISVADGDSVQGLDFFAQIGSGGSAPKFTGLSLTDGTIFAGNNAAQGSDGSNVVNGVSVSDSQASGFIATALNGVSDPQVDSGAVNGVAGAGVIAKLTVNTQGFAFGSGAFPLSLTPADLPATDFAGVPATITNGTVRIAADGDTDLDGDTDFADLGILLNNYNKPGGWSQGDSDLNGTVEFADLGKLLNKYNFVNQSAGAEALGAAVPEPSTWVLLALGALALAGRKMIRK